jgi:hypothetical protein
MHIEFFGAAVRQANDSEIRQRRFEPSSFLAGRRAEEPDLQREREIDVHRHLVIKRNNECAFERDLQKENRISNSQGCDASAD